MSARQRYSTGLLDEIVGSALEPAYRDGGSGSARRSWLLPVTAVAIGLLLAMAALAANAAEPVQTQARQELAERVQAESDRVAALQEQAVDLRADVSAQQRAALLAADADPDQLARVEVAAGTVAVTGPGVELTIDDADGSDTTDPELSRVLDSDLQLVANGLFAAGAEAVAVNGQRLTSLTAIRGAGEAILVNYRPLTRPYQVSAIGDPLRLEAAFIASPAGTALTTLRESYGIRADLRTVPSMTLPAASVATLRYAEAAS
jgi:uncharacterized protein YlxW (UPF0749 family)